MDPKPFAGGETVPQFRTVAGETLSEITAVVAAAEHAREVARQDNEKGEGKEKVVEEADHSCGSRR